MWLFGIKKSKRTSAPLLMDRRWCRKHIEISFNSELSYHGLRVQETKHGRGRLSNRGHVYSTFLESSTYRGTQKASRKDGKRV